jgi:tetratricopeptide (TPR) repeat protein
LLAYREAIKIKAQDIEARRSLCALLQESSEADEKEEALKLYQEILQLDSKDVGARLNLANLYSSANRLADAQEEYDAILRDKPEHAGALVGLGVVWRKRGKYEKALDLYHQALKTEPDLKIAHLNIAIIYDYYMNESPKAQIHYERYLQLKGDPKKIPEDSPVRGKLSTPAVQKASKETSSK